MFVSPGGHRLCIDEVIFGGACGAGRRGPGDIEDLSLMLVSPAGPFLDYPVCIALSLFYQLMASRIKERGFTQQTDKLIIGR